MYSFGLKIFIENVKDVTSIFPLRLCSKELKNYCDVRLDTVMPTIPPSEIEPKSLLYHMQSDESYDYSVGGEYTTVDGVYSRALYVAIRSCGTWDYRTIENIGCEFSCGATMATVLFLTRKLSPKRPDNVEGLLCRGFIRGILMYGTDDALKTLLQVSDCYKYITNNLFGNHNATDAICPNADDLPAFQCRIMRLDDRTHPHWLKNSFSKYHHNRLKYETFIKYESVFMDEWLKHEGGGHSSAISAIISKDDVERLEKFDKANPSAFLMCKHVNSWAHFAAYGLADKCATYLRIYHPELPTPQPRFNHPIRPFLV